MKKISVVFVSNYMNHHQKFLSDEFYSLLEGNYYFIETDNIGEERLKLGWKQLKTEYTLNVLESEENLKKARELILNADVVIYGAETEEFIKDRNKTKKITFRYSERLFKNKDLYPLKKIYRYFKTHYDNPRRANIYMLCSSAYTSQDYTKLGMFKNRYYRWGYFPECKIYPNIDEIIAQKEENTILWCGRFIDWKHLDDLLHAYKNLKSDKEIHLKIAGAGENEEEYRKLVEDLDLKNVTFLGSLSPIQVREEMTKASIYAFTSDLNEGWGVVLNESMNSGCAVVASHAIGSVPYLLSNNKNGLIYESGNIDDLTNKLQQLIDNPEMCKKFGKEAYKTITEHWSARAAAERLINLANHILDNKDNKEPYHLYESGPCSPDEVLDNWWIRKNKA